MMMNSWIEISNIYIIAKVFCKCAVYLTFVMPTVPMYYQISNKVSAIYNSSSLNTRKSFRSYHMKKSGPFGNGFCAHTSVITSGNWGCRLALGRFHMNHPIVSGLFSILTRKVYCIKVTNYSGGTIANISMMHTKEMSPKHFLSKNSVL